MYKNILIISDNLYLCRELEKIIDRIDNSDLTWTFAISPFSNLESFEAILKKEVEVMDLKDEKIIELVKIKFDIVFSIHCKQFFPSNLVNSVKCINVHPGYNPINRGWYPQVFAIVHNLPVGATIHEIDNELDHGKIIDRVLVEKSVVDTSETLYKKIVSKEIELLEKNLSNIIHGTYLTTEMENEGNLYLKKDFKDLCKLDLDEKLTMGDFINKARALTHGEFKNAYFIDNQTGRKVYLEINLQYEN